MAGDTITFPIETVLHEIGLVTDVDGFPDLERRARELPRQ
jgi:hypothetical protein